MRDYRDAKAMAKALRAGLAGQNFTVTHSAVLLLAEGNVFCVVDP